MSGSNNKKNAPRILVATPNWLGDIVMSLPALLALKNKNSGTILDALGKPHTHELLEILGIFENIHTVPTSGLLARSSLNNFSALRARHYTLGLSLPYSMRAALMLKAAGVKKIAGFRGQWRSPLLTAAIARTEHRPLNQTANYSHLVQAATGIEVKPELNFRLKRESLNLDWARQTLKVHFDNPELPLLIIHPTATYGPAKQWPGQSYADLINFIGAQRPVNTILIGTMEQAAELEYIKRRCQAGVLQMAGGTNLQQLLSLMELCALVVSNDSGPMHMASGLLNRHVIALFGSSDPRATGQQC